MADTIRYGSCTNKTQCSLAFNRESILVPPDGKCPECGRPLKVNSMASKFFRWLLLLLFLGALGAGGYYAKKTFLDPVAEVDRPHKLVTPPPEIVPDKTAGNRNPTPSGGNTDQTDASTPPPSAGPVSAPDFEANTANIQARKDVLKRISAMPHLTDQQRTQLRDAVSRARNMGCIFIIPFQNGQRTLDPRGTDILVSGFKSAAIQQLMKDPTVVFVVLGYADKQGDAATNEKVSLDRAQSVLSAMKDKCGVQNVTYGVAMGGSDLFDGKSATKNRLVEIWAAFP